MGSELNPGCLRCEILGLPYSALTGSLGSVVEGDTTSSGIELILPAAAFDTGLDLRV